MLEHIPGPVSIGDEIRKMKNSSVGDGHCGQHDAWHESARKGVAQTRFLSASKHLQSDWVKKEEPADVKEQKADVKKEEKANIIIID